MKLHGTKGEIDQIHNENSAVKLKIRKIRTKQIDPKSGDKKAGKRTKMRIFNAKLFENKV